MKNVSKLFKSLFENPPVRLNGSSEPVTVIQRADGPIKRQDIVLYHICCSKCAEDDVIQHFELRPNGDPQMLLCYSQTCEFCGEYKYDDFYITTDDTNLKHSQGNDIC